MTTEEARRWDEEPSGQVKGDSDPYYRSIYQSKAYRPLNVSVYVYTATQVPIVNQVKNLNHLFLSFFKIKNSYFYYSDYL